MHLKRSIRFVSLVLAVLLLLPVSMSAQAEKTSGVVRVLLTRLKVTDQVEISLDGSYTLNEIAFQRGSHLTVSCAKNELYVYYEGMSMKLGKQLTLVRHAVEDGQENGVRFNGSFELHPGDIRMTALNGIIRTVLHSPVEEYLLGVVPYEMSDSFPLEALKAQAVAARTYALPRTNSAKAYDVEDTTSERAYYGVPGPNKDAARALQ